MNCETCEDTGYYGDYGPGIMYNSEYHECDLCDIWDYVGHGYAPGGYINTCNTCGEMFTGDKRAYNCKACAMTKKHTPEYQI